MNTRQHVLARRTVQALAFAALFSLVAGCSKGGGRGNRGGRGGKDTITHVIKRSNLDVEVVETGKVAPRERIELKSRVAGQVKALHVEEGARVKKAQLLLELDPTDYERDLSRAKADLSQAEAALDLANKQLQRRRESFAAQGTSQSELDSAEADAKSRAAGVQMAKVSVAAASDRLSYTRLAAPIDGTVIERGIRVGEMVTPGVQATFEGKALLTVADIDTLLVQIDLNQIDIAKVALGQTAKVVVDALPGKEFEAKVTKIAPSSIKPKDKTQEVFPVEVTLAKVDVNIRPGMTADVRIHIDTKPNVLSAPIEAVVKKEGKSIVYRQQEKDATERDEIEVKTGARNDRSIELISGINEGDTLIIEPASSRDNEAQ